MSVEALSSALQATGLTPVQKLALVYLADNYMDGAGVGRLPLTPSAAVAAFAGCAPEDAAAAIKALFERGLLRRVPPPVELPLEPEQATGVWFHFHVGAGS